MLPSRRSASCAICACGRPSAPTMLLSSGTAEPAIRVDNACSLPCHGDVILERLMLVLHRFFFANLDQDRAEGASGKDIGRIVARNRMTPVQSDVDGLHR